MLGWNWAWYTTPIDVKCQLNMVGNVIQVWIVFVFLNVEHVSAKARSHVKHQNHSAAFANDLIIDRKSRKQVRKALAVHLSLSDQLFKQPQFF